MPGSADANLVLAALFPSDALHERARRHMARAGRLRVGLSVAAELFLILHRRGIPYQGFLAAVERHFDLDGRDVLYTAARALDDGLLKTPMDALHAADALHRGEPLHTADGELAESSFPTVTF